MQALGKEETCSIPTQPRIPTVATNIDFLTLAIEDMPLERRFQPDMRIGKMWCVYILLPHLKYVQALINFTTLCLSNYCLQFISAEKKPAPERLGKMPTADRISIRAVSRTPHAKGLGTTTTVVVLQPLTPFLRSLKAPGACHSHMRAPCAHLFAHLGTSS